MPIYYYYYYYSFDHLPLHVNILKP